MTQLAHNLIQVSAAFLLLCLMTVPTGWLSLRILRLGQGMGWLGLPVAALLGLLILPLYFNLLAAVINPLRLPVRIAAWLILNGLLWFVTSPSLLAGRGVESTPYEKLTYITKWQNLMLLAIGLIALLLTLFPLLLHDVPISGNWYYVMAGDWIKHIGVGDGLASDDHLPPANPFLSTESQLRYYYFAYIPPAMITQLSGGAITVTSSLTALAILIAFALPFLLYAYGRAVDLSSAGALFTTFMVILVSGMDILYVLDARRSLGYWVEHIDFWANHDQRRINSISNMFIWTPQHVLGVAGFIFVLWAIHMLWKAQTTTSRVAFALLIAVLIAALNGTSSFVWFGTMVGLAIFIVVETVSLIFKASVGALREAPAFKISQKAAGGSLGEGFRTIIYRSFASPLAFLIAAIPVSLILCLPYLNVVGGRSEAPAALEISPTVMGFKYGGIFSQLWGAHWLTYTLDFPFQMAVEFGLVMLTGILGWWIVRKRWSIEINVRLWTIMAVIAYLIVLAVRPGRPDSNNYAARVAPLLWVILGIWSGFWWMELRKANLRRRLIWSALCSILILAGLASTVYEAWIEQGSNYERLLGWDTSIQRNNFVSQNQHELYTWLDEHVKREEIYQIGWETNQATYFVQRRAAVTAGYLSLLYVSDPALFYVNAISSLESGFKLENPAEAAGAFQHIGIDYIVIERDQDLKLASQGDPHFADYFTLGFENEVYQAYRIHDPL